MLLRREEGDEREGKEGKGIHTVTMEVVDQIEIELSKMEDETCEEESVYR